MNVNTKLGDLLVGVGAITRSQLADALSRQEQLGGSLGAALLELGYVDDAAVAGALARQFNVPSMTGSQLERIAADVIALVPAEVAARLRVLPVRLDAGRLWLAMVDPTDERALKSVEALVRRPIRPLVISDVALELALEQHHRLRRRVRPAATAAPVATESYSSQVENEILDTMTGYIDEAVEMRDPQAARLTYADLLPKLLDAKNEEDVLTLLLKFLAADVARRAVLLLARDQLTVWRAEEMDLDVELGAGEAPLIAQILSTGEPHLGALLTADLGRLGRALEGGPNERLLLLPLTRGKKPVGVVIGLGAALDPASHLGGLRKLCAKIDIALQLVQLRRQLVAP